MRYLFLHYTPDVLGGIETLIARMSLYLVQQGNEVSIITTSANKWSVLLDADVRCVQLGEDFRCLFYPILVSKIWRKTGLKAPHVIKTFDLHSSWCGSLLAAELGGGVKLLSGIYNPYVFDEVAVQQRRMAGWKLYLKNYLQNIPPESRLVCDVEIQKELANIHGMRQTAQFWPLPIDGARLRSVKRKPRWGNIISIGRLSPMKEYNLYMLDVLHSLRANRYDVKWIVYGVGPYEQEMRQRISELNLVPYVELRGELEYSRLSHALLDAYIFVGMGTSIIEASFCGVPNVLALAYDRSGLTYGPLYNMPIGRVGQILGDQLPAQRIEDEIIRILKLDPDEYLSEELRVYNYALPYDLPNVMSQFESFVSVAPSASSNRFLHYTNYLYALARMFGISLDNYLTIK